MKNKRGYVYLILTIAIAGFILFTSTNSGESHSALGGRVIGWVNDVIFFGRLSEGEKEAIVSVGVKLFGHFGLFLLDGAFAYLTLWQTNLKKEKRILFLILFGAVLASCGEIVQIFSDGRTPSLTDVLTDFGGYLLPYLFVISFRRD